MQRGDFQSTSIVCGFEASGAGRCKSKNLEYEGEFYRGTFHDSTGKAVCTWKENRYVGAFQNGHRHGRGKLEMISAKNGEWFVYFKGEWRQDKMWSGSIYGDDGRVGGIIHEAGIFDFSLSEGDFLFLKGCIINIQSFLHFEGLPYCFFSPLF